jgi:hypothetical protein
MSTRELLRRARIRAGLLLIVVFVAGVISAIAMGRLDGSRALITVEAGGMPREIARLHLTPAQEQQVDTILRRSRADAEKVLLSTIPRLKAILDSTDDQVRTVLTPTQRAEFDAERQRHKPTFLLKRRSDTGAATVDSVGGPI